MKLHFLSADVPLSKTYIEIAPGQYKEESYPNVAKFTSLERSYKTLQDFSVTVAAAANEGMCLLKGLLDRQLVEESRAGHTLPGAETQWICLDVDYTVTDVSQDKFLAQLDPQLADVDFLFQYSAGQNIKNSEGWRGHFYILLDSPLPPPALKAWLIHLNLTSLPLTDRIGLSASGGALTYPLDVTTCQNDKLLYITPPTCKNFDDPVMNRFQLWEQDKRAVSLNLSLVSASRNDALKLAKLKELRSKANLPEKKFKTTTYGSLEIMTNPDKMTVTGRKEERGFVYLNLNGGDSWAYYFPVDKPDILFNFKGEPALYMKDVDSEIHQEYVKANATDSAGFIPLVFNWPANDSYYRCFANPDTGEHYDLTSTSSKAKLKDFLVANSSKPSKDWHVPDWELIFDPAKPGHADFTLSTINTYKPSTYSSTPADKKASVPATIDRVLTSLCIDDEIKARFLNWLAFIFQTRQKTNTAWIFQGVQGTGKGVLYERIIAPLLGRNYCHEMTMDRMADDFNHYLEENIILFIDEANITDSAGHNKLLDRIKTLITEPTQHIRAMRRNAVVRDSFTNVILATNYDESIKLEESDRRFNVAPRQEVPIQLEYDDILRIGEELSVFASFLNAYEINARDARTVIKSEARQSLIDASKTTLDHFFGAIRDGNLEYFTQFLDDRVHAGFDAIAYQSYASIVTEWVNSVGTQCKVRRDDLKSCYEYLQNTKQSVTKFSRMCTKYGLYVKSIRFDEGVARGVYVSWSLDEAEAEEIKAKQKKKTNVVPLRSKE